ncbi:MAG: methyltransferase domain-containing protein [Ornithinibacter sp.]
MTSWLTVDGASLRAARIRAELARRPGWQDPRWIRLLGPVELPSDARAACEAVDLESILAEGPQARDAKVSAAYDSLAGDYATTLASDLDGAPFERWLLERVVDLAGRHPVADVGCGPGLISAYLRDHGARVVGSDLSAEMVAQAQRTHRDITFEVRDLRHLMRPVDADGWGVVLAWYSLVHLAASELRGALEALVRPLRSDGYVVLSLFAGPSIRHVAELGDIPIGLEFVHHDPATVIAAPEAASLTDLEWYQCGVVPREGEPVHRFYLIGRRR